MVGNETPWHRAWKILFPEERQEICHLVPDGEIHRADIKTPTGSVIEVRHSASDAERLSRETFYGNLVWIIDGSAFRDDFDIYHMLLAPLSGSLADGSGCQHIAGSRDSIRASDVSSRDLLILPEAYRKTRSCQPFLAQP